MVKDCLYRSERIDVREESMKRNVLELLEEAAQKYTDKIAVKDNVREISFLDLCTDSQKIGSVLGKWNIFGKTIPVFMEKGVLTLEVFWGIVYGGGCYSLLNPIQPKERIEAILKIIGAPIIITDQAHFSILEKMDVNGQILLAEDLLTGSIDIEILKEIRKKAIDTDALDRKSVV